MSRAVRDAELIHLRQVRHAAERLVDAIARHYSDHDLEPVERLYATLTRILAEGRPADSTGGPHV